LPARIYANEGLAQVLFVGGDEVCETSYADRSGKYMRQSGITIPKAYLPTVIPDGLNRLAI
jgi:dCTP deaminase